MVPAVQRAASGFMIDERERVHRTDVRSRRAVRLRAFGVLIGLGLLLFDPARSRADADEDPDFFVLGAQQIGFSTGYGHGVSVTTAGAYEGNRVSELVLVGHWQIDVTRSPITPAWYKGVLALRIEPSLLVNFRPSSGVAGGVAAMLRYQWTRWGSTIPYFEAGAGIIGLDFDLYEQADGLAFNPTAGVGVVQHLGEHWAVDLEVRFQHVSNAYTQYPNGGFDTFQYLAGIAYRF
jgi:opacity protein-like surface antigen